MPDEVFRRDAFCPGYVDSFGSWNNGFACPMDEREPPMFCCGTATHRYCCRPTAAEDEQQQEGSVEPSHSLPLILGVVFGILIIAVLVITALCLFWRSWRAFKKQLRGGGQIFCVTGGGVANMYTGSLSRHSGRGTEEEDALQGVDEVAVTPPARLSTPITTAMPTSFSSDRGNRALLSDSSEDSSSSSAVSTAMGQLYVDGTGHQRPPPAYSFHSSSASHHHPLRTLSMTPPECITKADSDFGAGIADLTVYRDDLSRSSSMFRSTQF